MNLLKKRILSQYYTTCLLNDEYTPMDFVVELLLEYFNLNKEKATEIMLNVHHMGKAVCGTFSKDVASTKVEQVNGYALQNLHPLKCIISGN